MAKIAHVMIDLDAEILKAIDEKCGDGWKNLSYILGNIGCRALLFGKIEFTREELTKAIFDLIERKKIKIEIDINTLGDCFIYVKRILA